MTEGLVRARQTSGKTVVYWTDEAARLPVPRDPTGLDIETGARNRIAILTIVFNNGIMAAERGVLSISTQKYGALDVGGNYSKVAEALNVDSNRIDKPAGIVPAIKQAVAVTETGKPFLLEFLVKEGHEFSRYPLEGL